MLKKLFLSAVFLVAIFGVSCTLFCPTAPSPMQDCENMPFNIILPEGWTCKNTTYYYDINFDNGLTGYVQVIKKPEQKTLEEIRANGYRDYDGVVEGLSLLCKEIKQDNYCEVFMHDAGTAYRMVMENKSMSPSRLEEAEHIIKSVHLVDSQY
ncbi:MAG: hypothetical protein WC846_04500 [Candidatus Gracilibacteria bacterium]